MLKCLGATTRQIIAVYLLQVAAARPRRQPAGRRARRAAPSPRIPLGARSVVNVAARDVSYTVDWRVGAAGHDDRRARVAAVLARAAARSAARQAVAAAAPRSARRRTRLAARIAAMVVRRRRARRASRPGRRLAARRRSSSASALRRWRSCCIWPAALLVALMRRCANAPSFPLRHAVLHLSRPGNQTRVILLAVGLGAFFIVGVRSLQASLLRRVLDRRSARTRRTCSCSTSSATRSTACGTFLADPRNGAGSVAADSRCCARASPA